MEIAVLESTPTRVRLLVKDAPLALVNAVRRIALSEVPVMAVDEVIFLENNTAMYDEIIAHRLGLVPLTSERALEKYRPPEECAECTDCEDCFVSLYLDIAAEDQPVIVYSGDLKSTDPDVQPVYENMPLIYLAPGQRVSLEARARLGRGKEHAKWSAATIAAHKYLPVIRFDFTRASRETVEECIECIEGASREIARKLREMKRGEYQVLEDVNTSLYHYCSRTACKDVLEIEYRDDSFILTIESTGALPPKRILTEALRILEEKSRSLLRALGASTDGGEPG